MEIYAVNHVEHGHSGCVEHKCGRAPRHVGHEYVGSRWRRNLPPGIAMRSDVAGVHLLILCGGDKVAISLVCRYREKNVKFLGV